MTVTLFDDPYSYVHLALGTVAAWLICQRKASAALLLTAGFACYQLNEVESLESKRGDFLEFGSGFLVGAAILDREKRR